MMLAANLAGLAFNNPLTHVGHAAADALSGHFHTAHGYGCGICLPAAMRISAPAVPEKMRVIADALGIPLKGSESGEQLGDLVAEKIHEMMRALDVKSFEMGYKRMFELCTRRRFEPPVQPLPRENHRRGRI